jgi:phage terminase large subunit-like protein
MPATTDPADIDELIAFHRRVPGVIGNRFVVHYPHPKQQALLGAHLLDNSGRVFECLYGGAAGGGKSDALLMAAAQFVAWPHYRGLLLRRTHTELAKAGALMSRALQWWLPLGIAWDGTNKIARFPSGATIEFGYHAHANDDARYQGGEWHFVGFDELTHWPNESAYEWLRTRIRKSPDDPIPRRLLSTSNPGGPGHVWVKLRFIGGVDPATGRRIEPVARYIPATIDDNPSLDREPYKETLRDVHPTRRAQLLEGNWDARDPGDYFRIEWFGQLLDPERDSINHREAMFVRWWDLAASEAKDAARTAGVLMCRARRGVRAVVHATAFRKTPGARDDAIVRQAQIDGRHVTVGIEIEPGSGGVAQFDSLAKRLRAEGFRVVGARPKATQPELTDAEKRLMPMQPVSIGGKEGRADPVAACLERGFQMRGECADIGCIGWGVDSDASKAWWEATDGLRLFAGPWTQDYVDELEGFPGDGEVLCDLVDATSGAWAWLEAHPFGMQAPPRDSRHVAASVSMHDITPDDRERFDAPRNYRDRWKL